MSALTDVLDTLARTFGGPERSPVRLGEIMLHGHQAEAVARIRSALAEFGGALLADEPGLGKTYVALALAAEYGRALVAAPASLREMWIEAAQRAGVAIDFVSLEELSRGRTPCPARLLIVDEAHRAANPAARRYRRISSVAHHAHVLVMTATPVRNRRAELEALLGIFLGPGAAGIGDEQLARLTVRRTADELRERLPEVRASRVIRPRDYRDGRDLAAALGAIPPPLALAEGSAAAALVRTSLARCWASSIAALDRALKRRDQRGAALLHMIDAGRTPTRADLSAWVVGDDAMQLAFSFGAADPWLDLAPHRNVVDIHIGAVRALRSITRRTVESDTDWRAARIRLIARRHAGSTVIAFTMFEATAAALFVALRGFPGLVLLTGRGCRTSAGKYPRGELLAALGVSRGRESRAAEPIRLVIATDLLSEGVNLQGASVVVHLDDPWTPAAITQRVGRAARLGSSHERVTVYRFAPPASAEALLGLRQLHANKAIAARRSLAAGDAVERLRSAILRWCSDHRERAPAVAACAFGRCDAFIARLDDPGHSMLVAGMQRAPRAWRITADPVTIRRLVESVRSEVLDLPTRGEVAAAAKCCLRWCASRTVERDGASAAPQSVSRRRVLARLDAMVRMAPPIRRPALSARVGELRARLALTRGAGTELRLAALLDRPATDDAWLGELDAILASAVPRDRPLTAAPTVAAILFLRRAPPTTSAPAPAPSPPSASPGTAAPR